MTPEPIPVRSSSMLECRSCGAGAPVDEHFCPQCSRILALGRHGDFFSFLGLPRKLVIDADDLERRFRDLSRKFHPDYFYNASPTERLASLERSSYLNDAFRTLKNPVTRIEHPLAIEGLPPAKSEQGTAKVPPSLLEEVFALNEELDEIRERRESGADAASLERSSYLNDAFRSVKNPVTRIEHLLAIEGLPPAKSEQGTAKVPPSLLEEVFEQ